MKTLLSFVKRDLKDNFLLIAMTLTMASPLIFYQTTQVGFDSTSILGFLFFFFFTIYLSKIWNGVTGASLSREYLLSLPISRSKMFWIMWARSFVGFTPIFCVAWFSRSQIRMKFFHTIALTWRDDALFLTMLIIGSWMFMMNLATSQTTQSQMLMSRKRGKLIPVLKLFARMGFDGAMIFAWIGAFLMPVEFLLSVILASIAIVYYSLKNRIAFIQWMWGVDATLFRRR
ncbi:MAG: hypothetical protein KA715_14600 [Xanthomonadaceae bacterium]|nr:hypothetical protein [Xanthomonadaceae bacterium]